MAKQGTLYLPAAANNQSVALTSADTTVATLCFTNAGSDDADVKAIVVASDDTAAINLRLYVVRSGVNYLLGTVNIPAAAGSNGVAPSVDLLAGASIPGLPLDNVGKRYLPLKAGDTLKVACLVTMTAAKTCWVSVFGQDY